MEYTLINYVKFQRKQLITPFTIVVYDYFKVSLYLLSALFQKNFAR